ncbi:MAG: hypothetical protein HON04_17905 [Planctomicrobium sp.]|nr:hypothetical protein [Planctomicrobium sp.]
MFHVDRSGSLWPDAARYRNATLMIHDWIHSGQYVQPLEFAKEYYTQYPGFSVPFHPPGYPGLMALSCLIFGTSYWSVRLFISLMLGLATWSLYGILRKNQFNGKASFFGACVWLTTPEVVHWSRTTMSEIPATAMILLASLSFLMWIETNRSRYVWLAFSLAYVAFLCRYTTAGVLPAWFLFSVAIGSWRRMLSPHVILPSIFYLVFGVAYLQFAKPFARYEFAADGKEQGITWNNVLFFSESLGPMLFWGTSLLMLIGAFRFYRVRKSHPVGVFFLCWLVSFTVFKVFVPSSFELRHFFGVIPAMAGLAAGTFLWKPRRKSIQTVKFAIIVFAFSANLSLLIKVPYGVVGYENLANEMSTLPREGNVLMACHEDQDLIFRYRSHAGIEGKRHLVRGDRVLARRLPSYAKVAVEQLVNTQNDVIEVIKTGGIRYVVTCESSPAHPRRDAHYPEFVLAHQTAISNPTLFRQISQSQLFIQYEKPGRRYKVFLWEFDGKLPSTQNQLPVEIPTWQETISKKK